MKHIFLCRRFDICKLILMALKGASLRTKRVADRLAMAPTFILVPFLVI